MCPDRHSAGRIFVQERVPAWRRCVTARKRRPADGFLRMYRMADRHRYQAIFEKYVRDCCANRTVARLSELAQLLGRSRPSLSRIILVLFGKSPTQILRELRLEEAKRLLRVTDMGLDEIAAASACGHRTTLNRVFTKAFHMTPAEYREASKGPASSNRVPFTPEAQPPTPPPSS
jgi:AraC-like DNA-binding protein